MSKKLGKFIWYPERNNGDLIEYGSFLTVPLILIFVLYVPIEDTLTIGISIAVSLILLVAMVVLFSRVDWPSVLYPISRKLGVPVEEVELTEEDFEIEENNKYWTTRCYFCNKEPICLLKDHTSLCVCEDHREKLFLILGSSVDKKTREKIANIGKKKRGKPKKKGGED